MPPLQIEINILLALLLVLVTILLLIWLVNTTEAHIEPVLDKDLQQLMTAAPEYSLRLVESSSVALRGKTILLGKLDSQGHALSHQALLLRTNHTLSHLLSNRQQHNDPYFQTIDRYLTEKMKTERLL